MSSWVRFESMTFPAEVLFDSGASHSFISIDFAHRHNIPFENMHTPMVVNTPGSQLADQMDYSRSPNYCRILVFSLFC